MQLKGKAVSEAGRVPRTTLEYDFVLSHPELAKDFGPVLTYFSRNLDEGLLDFSGYESLPLELVTPKNEQEMFADVQKFFDTMPSLTHEITVKNPKTKVERDVVLSGLSDFFV